MLKYLIAYAATAAFFIIVDLVWLAYVARSFYAERMGDLLLEQPKMGIALAFYVLFCAGIVIFAVLPALNAGSLLMAMGYGALFGFFAYATYDLTNLAVLKNWPLDLSLVDMAWGSALTAGAAAAGFAATSLAMQS